ncbi:MBL fold metallo-hydrolase [Geotalea sp. SG265]|uniref:ribonuclease Z n=1 Tax=Geotalea sp. SG265 TaxID=2922867 RepID=UPI001FB03F34|nr:MBL fold metallo-hydrolase [Geotalea sp. SG265]
MKRRLPFRYLEPTFFAGLLDDPLLLVNVRPWGRALLFDCGQLHHLAKRVLRSINAIFISHAHMDHFMGMDTFIRHNHVSPRSVDIFGPPGITERMESKLRSYDWNLSEPYWCTFRVHEIHAGHWATTAFSGAGGFRRQPPQSRPLEGEAVYENPWLKVEAISCDHKIPSLIFKVTERESFAIDEEKMAAAGLVKGEWLRQLKKHFYGRAGGDGLLRVARLQGGEIVSEEVHDLDGLYASIRRRQRPASIGYVTDVGFTEENLARMERFLGGVTLLVCECSFIAEDRDKARASYHLCTADLNCIIERLRPRFVLPMHLSKAYLERSRLVYRQLMAPPGVTVLKVTDRVTPRPLAAWEVPQPEWSPVDSRG